MPNDSKITNFEALDNNTLNVTIVSTPYLGYCYCVKRAIIKDSEMHLILCNKLCPFVKPVVKAMMWIDNGIFAFNVLSCYIVQYVLRNQMRLKGEA